MEAIKNRIALEISFVISAGIFCTMLILFFIPTAPMPVPVFWQPYLKIFWWGCGILTLFLGKNIKGNIIGTIMVAIFGPISLLTLGFYYLYIKFQRRHNEGNKEH